MKCDSLCFYFLPCVLIEPMIYRATIITTQSQLPDTIKLVGLTDNALSVYFLYGNKPKYY